MSGPFPLPPMLNLVVLMLGVVHKIEANKFCHHLSFLKGALVNDGIDHELLSFVYMSFNVVIGWVRRFCRGALLAKMDIKSALIKCFE